MGLSDSQQNPCAVIDSHPRLGFSPIPPGLPGSSTDLSPRAVPNHPGRSDGCSCRLLHHRSLASAWSALWPPSYSHRSRIGFTCVTAHGFASRIVLAPWLKPPLVRLHVEQAIYMVNSIQFTGSARLVLVTDRQGVVRDGSERSRTLPHQPAIWTIRSASSCVIAAR